LGGSRRGGNGKSRNACYNQKKNKTNPNGQMTPAHTCGYWMHIGGKVKADPCDNTFIHTLKTTGRQVHSLAVEGPKRQKRDAPCSLPEKLKLFNRGRLVGWPSERQSDQKKRRGLGDAMLLLLAHTNGDGPLTIGTRDCRKPVQKRQGRRPPTRLRNRFHNQTGEKTRELGKRQTPQNPPTKSSDGG